jgi:hypothetical protein
MLFHALNFLLVWHLPFFSCVVLTFFSPVRCLPFPLPKFLCSPYEEQIALPQE